MQLQLLLLLVVVVLELKCHEVVVRRSLYIVVSSKA
jgi:hypothetical protein